MALFNDILSGGNWVTGLAIGVGAVVILPLAAQFCGLWRRLQSRAAFWSRLRGGGGTKLEPGFWSVLAGELRALGVTTLHTVELPELMGTEIRTPTGGVPSMAEVLILLRYVETLRPSICRHGWGNYSGSAFNATGSLMTGPVRSWARPPA